MTLNTITLVPGTPDDDNRDYLPEAIKGSDIVVNENGNNSQPYPKRLIEHVGVVADGETDTWYTYVPENYDGTKPVPLVVSMHGGLMTGWGQAIYTSWTLLAEREGFICLFPSAHERRFWTVEVAADQLEESTRVQENGVYLNRPPADPHDNHDLTVTRTLIASLCEQYNIDTSRVYMQGMSMGNIMTDQFARHFGHLLAGAGGSGGPASPSLLFDGEGRAVNSAGPVAAWQTRLDRDVVPPTYAETTRETVVGNREYWFQVNGITTLPSIAIDGESNFAFYEGEHAPMVFRDVYNRDHGQTFDDAEIVWDYLYSGVRRAEDGSIELTESIIPRRGDAVSVAVAEGRAHAWSSQRVVDMGLTCFRHDKLKYHGLDGGEMVRGSYLYVPLTFIAAAFGGDLEQSPEGLTARLTLADGRVVEFARGIIGAVVAGRIRSMYAEAITREGQLCISLEWLCDDVLGLRTTVNGNVLYVTDHHALLGQNMAELIDDILADAERSPRSRG